ncbi:unnamed protein product [Chrysoparadoxa australica]
MDYSTEEEEDDLLKHLPRAPDKGMLLELQLTREARERDQKMEDNGSCVVDKSQFFNTQVGVGYQHKSVIRQRVAGGGNAPAKPRRKDMGESSPVATPEDSKENSQLEENTAAVEAGLQILRDLLAEKVRAKELAAVKKRAEEAKEATEAMAPVAEVPEGDVPEDDGEQE